MPNFLRYRETVEKTITWDDNGRETVISSVLIEREEMNRWHEPDGPHYEYFLDPERGLNLLMVDGVEEFAHRSHDTVLNRYSYLTGDPLTEEFRFQDADDPEKSWQITAEIEAMVDSE